MTTLTPLSSGPGLTALDLLQLPRPGTAIPNPSGTRALWPASAFAFDAAGGKGRTAKSVYLVNLPKPPVGGAAAAAPGANAESGAGAASGGIKEILSNLVYSEAVWLDDNNFLFLRPPFVKGEGVADGGERVDHPVEVSDKDNKARIAKAAEEEGGEGVELWAHDLTDGEDYLITKLPVVVSNLKAVRVSSSKEQGAILSFSAEVFPDGDIYAVAAHEKQLDKDQAGSDVRVYDSTFARHWDHWTPTAGQRSQLFFLRLTRNPESFVSSSDDDFEAISKAELPEPRAPGKWAALEEAVKAEAGFTRKVAIKAPLAGTPLECPVGPFGGAEDFTLSSTHLAFHAKDPLVNPAWHTRTNVYLVPLSPKSKADAEPRALTVGTQGASSSPVFSPDGSRLAWLEMREDGYEADRNRVMVYEVKTGLRWGATESHFDRSPGHLEWSPDGQKLFFTAEDDARVKLYELAVPVPKEDATVADVEAAATVEPIKLTHQHSVTGFSPLTPTSVLLTTNSLTRPNELSLVTFLRPDGAAAATSAPEAAHLFVSSLTPGLGEHKPLDEGESFYFTGAQGVRIQGWILFPPGLQEPKARRGLKLPLAFLVHGGPEGAWTDSWSTRWNPNIYCSAGYVTVAINPTGSTGFGEALTRGIRGQWGGRPFQDLVAGLEYVKDKYPEIDGDRTAMLGASYGGFMANWIQGHNEVTKFQAIVCHDGVFNTASSWYTGDELYFPEKEFGGTPWEAPTEYDKWSPHNHVAKWNTPQLIIHGSKDYRLVEGEGLAAFNTLQRLGVPSRLVVFPSENHWVLSPHNSVKWHKQVLGWIGEWTAEKK